MVRAPDELAARLAADRQQLVPAVSADVVEGAQKAVLAAHEEDGLPAREKARWSPTSSRPLARPTRLPAPVEEVLLLPPEDGIIGVRLGGEGAAAAERGQGGRSSSRAMGVTWILPSLWAVWAAFAARMPQLYRKRYRVGEEVERCQTACVTTLWSLAVGTTGSCARRMSRRSA